MAHNEPNKIGATANFLASAFFGVSSYHNLEHGQYAGAASSAAAAGFLLLSAVQAGWHPIIETGAVMREATRRKGIFTTAVDAYNLALSDPDAVDLDKLAKIHERENEFKYDVDLEVDDDDDDGKMDEYSGYASLSSAQREWERRLERARRDVWSAEYGASEQVRRDLPAYVKAARKMARKDGVKVTPAKKLSELPWYGQPNDDAA